MVEPRYAAITWGSVRTSARRSVGDHASPVENDDAFCERADELHVVLDENHRETALRQSPQRFDQPLLLPRAQPRSGLVEQEQRRLLREGACDRQQPELSERKNGRRIRRATVEPDDLERSTGFPPHPLLFAPLPGRPQHALDETGSRANVGADSRVVEHVELAERTRCLEDGREPAARPAVRRPPRDVLPRDAHGPLVHRVES